MLTFSYRNAWAADYSGTAGEISWMKRLFTYKDLKDFGHKQRFGYFPEYSTLGEVMSHGQVIHAIREAGKVQMVCNVIDTSLRYRVETGRIPPDYLPKCTGRDYQLLSAEIGLGSGHGIIKIGTGGGKTVIMGMMVKTLIQKTDVQGILILILSKDLLDQTAGRFASYGVPAEDIGIIHSDISPKKQQEASQKRVILSTHLSIPKFKGTIDRVQYVLCDECHKSIGPLWSALFPMLPNLTNVVGFTATPWDNEGERQKMLAIYGQVLLDIPVKWLIEKGYLLKPDIYFIRLWYKDKNNKLIAQMDWRAAEKHFILEERNRNLLPVVVLNKYGGRMLVLYRSLPHGKHLQSLYTEHGYETRLAEGITSTEDRKSAIEWFERPCDPGQHGKVLLASKVFDEGIDIKGGCDLGFLIGAGQDESQTKQRTGRLLRMNSTGKVRIFDAQDTNHPILSRWSGSRRRAIREETGIDPKIISLETFATMSVDDSAIVSEETQAD